MGRGWALVLTGVARSLGALALPSSIDVAPHSAGASILLLPKVNRRDGHIVRLPLAGQVVPCSAKINEAVD